MTGITATDLKMHFGAVKAVNGLSFDVKSGEFVTLLGPSGCGKTTLLRMVSGFLTPTSGRIHIDGQDVTDVAPENRDTALCFQSYALFPHLTVRENLEFGLKQKRLPKAQRVGRLDDAVDQLGLGAQLDKLPNQLSGGQQQRVALGRALVMRPSVIMFDEPLSSLDAKLREQLRIEVRRIQRDFDLTAIYVTHDQAEALALSDRIFVMKAGRIEQSDTPEQLYHCPRTSFVADFVGGANVLQGEVMSKTSQGHWHIETPLGQIDAAAELAPSTRHVTLCWRPEDAVIGDGPFAGKVVNRAFQGHFTDLMMETNGMSYRLQTPRSDAREGDIVHFALAPDDVTILEDNV